MKVYMIAAQSFIPTESNMVSFLSHYAEYLNPNGDYVDLESILGDKETTSLDIVVFGKNVYGNLKNVYSIPSRRGGTVAATISVAYEMAKEEDGCKGN